MSDWDFQMLYFRDEIKKYIKHRSKREIMLSIGYCFVGIITLVVLYQHDGHLYFQDPPTSIIMLSFWGLILFGIMKGSRCLRDYRAYNNFSVDDWEFVSGVFDKSFPIDDEVYSHRICIAINSAPEEKKFIYIKGEPSEIGAPVYLAISKINKDKFIFNKDFYLFSECDFYVSNDGMRCN